MASFDDFLDALADGIKDLLTDFVDEGEGLLKASKDFLQESEQDLKKWTGQLAAGEMTPDDFKFLVEGKKDLFEVHANANVGLAKAQVDKFWTALRTLVVDTAIGMLP